MALSAGRKVGATVDGVGDIISQPNNPNLANDRTRLTSEWVVLRLEKLEVISILPVSCPVQLIKLKLN